MKFDMKRKNLLELLRGCLTDNLAFWVDDEENPVIQKWFAENYGALKKTRLICDTDSDAV